MGKMGKTQSVWRRLGRFARDSRGNIAAMTALLLIPLVGVLGIATETGNWYLIQRSMQNAADSAVIAAAINANATNNSYQLEGKQVATKFGYTNGASSTTVTIINNDNTVPSKCASACYAATITRTVPVYLTRIVGWSATQAITAKAVAVPQNVPTDYCLVSLAGPGNDGYHINGGPSVNLTGCNVLSNGDVTCNGANSSGQANSITYIGVNKNSNCTPSVSSSTPLADPYSGQASNLPPVNCGASAPTTLAGALNANVALPGTTFTGAKRCGNVTLTGDVTVSTDPNGSLLVIENGFLDLAGFKLSSSGPLTIVFTGTSGGLSSSMSGTFDFSGPTAASTSVWAGYSIYQNPTNAITSSIASGGGVAWKISGIIYLPRTNLQFNGTVEKATGGYDCFVLVDYTFQANGTGNILEHQTECPQQNVNLPSLNTFTRAALVY